MSDINKYYNRTDLGDSDFWDLSKNRAASRPAPSYGIGKKPSPEGVLVESGAESPEVSYKIPEKKVNFSSPDTVIEYTPENIFINKVKITTTDKDKNIFNPSALFMRERAALLHKVGKACDYVSFYAHSPRYSGMTRPQLAYYLWWRENIRRGELIKTDISYVKLYIQEIVTASSDEDIRTGLSNLIKIAKSCFDNPVGKVYMARIISDFCLIHSLECPTDEIVDILPHFVFEHVADEFFLGLSEKNRDIYAPIAINYVSIYNYKKSKFYEGDNCDLFDRHILAAIQACLKNRGAYDAIAKNASGIFSTKLSDRKLFDGRVEFCAPSTRILVSYFPVSCISGVITDAIRYAENKLRSLLSVRTSLAVGELPIEITGVIDDYFSTVAHEFNYVKAASKQKQEKKAEQEYDRLYDIPRRELSLSNAKKIEAASWQTTIKLTEAFTESAECRMQNAECEAPVGDGVLGVPINAVGAIHESPANPAVNNALGVPMSTVGQGLAPADNGVNGELITECRVQNAECEAPVGDDVLGVPRNAECRMQNANESAECRVQNTELQSNEDSCPQQKSSTALHSSPWGEHHEFLLICLNGTASDERAYARSHGLTVDELADMINELSVELIGDIILDSDGEKYTVIEDYIDIIEEK